jgi:predicted membrane-bound spermidine synthase
MLEKIAGMLKEAKMPTFFKNLSIFLYFPMVASFGLVLALIAIKAESRWVLGALVSFILVIAAFVLNGIVGSIVQQRLPKRKPIVADDRRAWEKEQEKA